MGPVRWACAIVGILLHLAATRGATHGLNSDNAIKLISTEDAKLNVSSHLISSKVLSGVEVTVSLIEVDGVLVDGLKHTEIVDRRTRNVLYKSDHPYTVEETSDGALAWSNNPFEFSSEDLGSFIYTACGTVQSVQEFEVEPVWKPVTGGILRPSWKVTLTQESGQSGIVYVGAKTQVVLSCPSHQTSSSNLISKAPTLQHRRQLVEGYAYDLSNTQLVMPGEEGATPATSVELLNLIDGENGLSGKYFEVLSCCFSYVCNDGTTTCSGTSDSARCAHDDDDPALVVQAPSSLHSTPGRVFFTGLQQMLVLAGRDMSSTPMVELEDGMCPAYYHTTPCLWLPWSTKSINNGTEGFWSEPKTPVSPRTGGDDFPNVADGFAEVQAYYTVSTMFEYYRDEILQDPTWCLSEFAQTCDDDGQPLVDSVGKPLKRLAIRTSGIFQDIANVVDQATQYNTDGLGLTSATPFKFDYWGAFNGFFYASETAEEDDYIELWTSVTMDVAYDPFVVAHELAHAIFNSVAGVALLQNQFLLDSQGLYPYMGALHEAISDYLAGSFLEVSHCGLFEASKDLCNRDMENERSFPADIVGQSHYDSRVFSGVLWDIRKAAKELDIHLDFDKLVAAFLPMIEPTDTYWTLGERLRLLIQSELPQLFSTSENAFDAHGLLNEVDRVLPLEMSVEDANLYWIPGSATSKTGVSTAPVQFSVTVNAGDLGFYIETDVFQTYVDSVPWLDESQPLYMFVSEGCGIEFEHGPAQTVLDTEVSIPKVYICDNSGSRVLAADFEQVILSGSDPERGVVKMQPFLRAKNLIFSGGFMKARYAVPASDTSRTFFITFANVLNINDRHLWDSTVAVTNIIAGPLLGECRTNTVLLGACSSWISYPYVVETGQTENEILNAFSESLSINSICMDAWLEHQCYNNFPRCSETDIPGVGIVALPRSPCFSSCEGLVNECSTEDQGSGFYKGTCSFARHSRDEEYSDYVHVNTGDGSVGRACVCLKCNPGTIDQLSSVCEDTDVCSTSTFTCPDDKVLPCESLTSACGSSASSSSSSDSSVSVVVNTASSKAGASQLSSFVLISLCIALYAFLCDVQWM